MTLRLTHLTVPCLLLLTVACDKALEIEDDASEWVRARRDLPTQSSPPPQQGNVPRHVQLSARLDMLEPAKQQAKEEVLAALIDQLGQRLGDDQGVVGLTHEVAGAQSVSVGLKASDACESCVGLTLGFGSTYSIDLPVYSGQQETDTNLVLVAPLAFAQQEDRLVVYLDLARIGETGLGLASAELGALPESAQGVVQDSIREYWSTYLKSRVPRLRLGTLPLPDLGTQVSFVPSDVVFDATQSVFHVTLGTDLPGLDSQLSPDAIAWQREDSFTLSMHPDVLVSASRMAMGRGELSSRYDALGRPEEDGRFGVVVEDSKGSEGRVTLDLDIFDFAQSEDPAGVMEPLHISSKQGGIIAEWANDDMDSERGNTLAVVRDTWVARYETWLGRAQLDTSFVDVGLLDTRCSATSLSWHTGVKLDAP